MCPIGYFKSREEVMAASSPATARTSKVKFSEELLPSEIQEINSPAVRKYLRRDTDIPVEDHKPNVSQGRIAGRIVRITCTNKPWMWLLVHVVTFL